MDLTANLAGIIRILELHGRQILGVELWPRGLFSCSGLFGGLAKNFEEKLY